MLQNKQNVFGVTLFYSISLQTRIFLFFLSFFYLNFFCLNRVKKTALQLRNIAHLYYIDFGIPLFGTTF